MIDKLKVGAVSYEIEVTKFIELGENYSGQINYHDGKIQIRPRREDLMLETMMHEMIHAIDDFLGIKREEDETERYAQALAMIAVDNPKLFDLSSYKTK